MKRITRANPETLEASLKVENAVPIIRKLQGIRLECAWDDNKSLEWAHQASPSLSQDYVTFPVSWFPSGQLQSPKNSWHSLLPTSLLATAHSREAETKETMSSLLHTALANRQAASQQGTASPSKRFSRLSVDDNDDAEDGEFVDQFEDDEEDDEDELVDLQTRPGTPVPGGARSVGLQGKSSLKPATRDPVGSSFSVVPLGFEADSGVVEDPPLRIGG